MLNPFGSVQREISRVQKIIGSENISVLKLIIRLIISILNLEEYWTRDLSWIEYNKFKVIAKWGKGGFATVY